MKLPGMSRTLSLIVFLNFSVARIFAQMPASDSVFYQKAVSNTVALYHSTLGDQSGLYNGTQYPGYPFTFKEGHPFFYTDTPDTGSVVYDGVLYNNVSLQYDELSGMLVMQDHNHRILLRNERVAAFTLFNSTFIRVIKDSSSRALYETGYYDLVYNGRKIQVLSKEIKKIREQLQSSTEGIWRFIDIRSEYYIKKDNNYITVSGRKDLLRVYKDHKKEVQQFIKSNKLSFRKNPAEMLAKASEYYEQLTK